MRTVIKIMLIIVVTTYIFSCENEVAENSSRDDINIMENSTLKWNISYMPRSFYPSMNLSDTEKQIVNQLYEGLVCTYDNEIVFGMAESVKISLDGLVYDFKLKNAQWSDGVIIKPEDFIYSWERKNNYWNDVNLLYYDSMIDYVEATEDRHLKIILKHPNKNLLHELSTVAFMPVRKDTIDLDKKLPNFIADVTNGAYTLSSNSIYSKITLKKNVHYYDYYDVHIEEIDLSISNNYSLEHSKFNNEKFDIVQSISNSAMSNLIQNEPDFHLFKKNGVYNFSFNLSNDYLKIKEIRQILNLAIDRSELNPFNSIISSTVAYSVVNDEIKDELRKNHNLEFELMSGLDSYNVSREFAETDKIKKLLLELDDSALKNINNLSIITLNTPNDIEIANMIKKMWKENLNIFVEVKVKDQYDYNYALRTNSYDIILNNYYYMDKNIRNVLKHFLSDTFINKSKFTRKSFDNKLLKTVEYNDSNLDILFINLIGEIDGLATNMPLFEVYEPVLINSDVSNWSRSYESLFYFGRAAKIINAEE